MELKDLRNEIDAIDDELVRLFVKRMECSAQVADYKKEYVEMSEHAKNAYNTAIRQKENLRKINEI